MSRLCAVLSQTRFPTADDRLGSVSDLQLGEDVRDVVANGFRAQRQLPGDPRVGVSLRDKVEDLRN